MKQKDFWSTYLDIISVLGFISIIMFIILILELFLGGLVFFGNTFIITTIIIGFLMYNSIDKSSLKKMSIVAGFFGIFSEITGFPFGRPGWGFLGVVVFVIFPFVVAYWLSK